LVFMVHLITQQHYDQVSNTSVFMVAWLSPLPQEHSEEMNKVSRRYLKREQCQQETIRHKDTELRHAHEVISHNRVEIAQQAEELHAKFTDDLTKEMQKKTAEVQKY
jgi:hypothetical protein